MSATDAADSSANFVLPNLLLGDITSISGCQLSKSNVTHVLSCIRGFSVPQEPCVQCNSAESDGGVSLHLSLCPAFQQCGRTKGIREWMVIDVDDSEDEDLLKHVPQCVEFIRRSLSESGFTCLVHCAAGQSRSATIVLAFLMAERKMSMQQAIEYVSAVRPMICPNPGFRRQLELFETLGCSLISASASDPRLVAHRIASRLVRLSRIWNENVGMIALDELAEDPAVADPLPIVGRGASALFAVAAASASIRAVGSRCGHCGFILFSLSSNVAHSCASGQYVFLEPMQWMHCSFAAQMGIDVMHGVSGGLSDPSGRLKCPNVRCGAKIGLYQWKKADVAKHACSCKKYDVFPMFKLQKTALR